MDIAQVITVLLGTQKVQVLEPDICRQLGALATRGMQVQEELERHWALVERSVLAQEKMVEISERTASALERICLHVARGGAPLRVDLA